MQLDLLMKPMIAVISYCRLPIWTTAQQSVDGASCEESEQDNFPTGGIDGSKDQQGNVHANQLRTRLQGKAQSKTLALTQAATLMTNPRGADQNMERVMTS